VTVLACKEAVFKAFSAAPDAHGLSLTMRGGRRSGWAALDGMDPALVAASWVVSEASILVLAVASPSGRARRLLWEMASGGVGMESSARRAGYSGLTHDRDTLHPVVTVPA
jgi:hypothetical protein